MSKLRDALRKITDAVDDLSSLSVETYSGAIDATVQSDQADEFLDWEQVIAKAKADGTTIKLKLASKYRVDGDATLFVAEEGVTLDMREAHAKAVDAGRQTRTDLIELFRGVVEGAL